MSSVFENLPNLGNMDTIREIAILTGAGMSAESGLRTFRDNNGLWEEYSVYEVATPEAWRKDPELVLRFYNERRRQLLECEPNSGHFGLAELESRYEVNVITQNIDDLHERGGSSHVLHLHGELRKSRSSVNPDLIYDIEGWELTLGERCERGSQLRPHVVWFGEAVPMIDPAARLISTADLLIIVGTSLGVYPAAGLIHAVKPGTPIVLVDPNDVDVYGVSNLHHIRQTATAGVKELVTKLLAY